MADTHLFPSKAILGSHWKGIEGLQYIVIFGASYCDVGASLSGGLRGLPTPTPAEPLGYEYPGMTYTESGKPNWVGHLITNHLPKNPRLLVYNYAMGGAVVSGVLKQYKLFKDHIGELALNPPLWNAENTLFATWIGINDCAYITMGQGSVDRSLEALFAMKEALYDAGARNFLFINVPPVNRMPCAPPVKTYVDWNTRLAARCEQFHASHSDISLLEFSAWEAFNKLFDNPEMFGFSQEDISRTEGSMFIDGLHPTSAVHNIFAESLGKWLEAL